MISFLIFILHGRGNLLYRFFILFLSFRFSVYFLSDMFFIILALCFWRVNFFFRNVRVSVCYIFYNIKMFFLFSYQSCFLLMFLSIFFISFTVSLLQWSWYCCFSVCYVFSQHKNDLFWVFLSKFLAFDVSVNFLHLFYGFFAPLFLILLLLSLLCCETMVFFLIKVACVLMFYRFSSSLLRFLSLLHCYWYCCFSVC